MKSALLSPVIWAVDLGAGSLTQLAGTSAASCYSHHVEYTFVRGDKPTDTLVTPVCATLRRLLTFLVNNLDAPRGLCYDDMRDELAIGVPYPTP